MIIDFANSLDLFFGDANPAETRVYARVTSWSTGFSLPDSLKAGLQLVGSLTGPYCEYAQTLPATIPLTDTGPGKTLLAQATVPDPCFWTPELPYLYQAKVELRRGQEVLTACERPFGIRPLGARGRRFYYEGKPWVLRAVSSTGMHHNLREYHEVDAAMFVDNPSDELCELAGRLGVLLVADLSSQMTDIAGSIRRLTRQAAVGFIVIGDELPDDAEPRAWGPNVVLVQRIENSKTSQRQWANALLCPADQVDELTSAARLPVIAYRPAAASNSVARSRALCDVLQRDLVHVHEIGGYLV